MKSLEIDILTVYQTEMGTRNKDKYSCKSYFWVSSGLLPGLLSKLNNDKFIPVDEHSVLPNLYGYEIFFYLVGAVRVWRKKLDFKYSYKTWSGARSRLHGLTRIIPNQSGKIEVLIFHMKKIKK